MDCIKYCKGSDLVNKSLFKIMNRDMKHHNFQYVIGKNTDINDFDTGVSCYGGLYFADRCNIMRFLNIGDKIASVVLDDNEDVCIENHKYKAHTIYINNIKDIKSDIFSCDSGTIYPLRIAALRSADISFILISFEFFEG